MRKPWLFFLLLSAGSLWSQSHPKVHSMYVSLDSIYKERKSEEFRLDGAEFARGTVFRTRAEIFSPDSYTLVSEDVPTLDSLARTMRLFPNIRVEVRMCFSDSARAATLGKLDRQRAAVVRDYLIKKGIASQRIRAVAGGYQYPLIPEHVIQWIPDPAARAKWTSINERLEFVILTPAFGY